MMKTIPCIRRNIGVDVKKPSGGAASAAAGNGGGAASAAAGNGGGAASSTDGKAKVMFAKK